MTTRGHRSQSPIPHPPTQAHAAASDDPLTASGQSHPLGTSIRPGGVNFGVFSKNCTAIELLLFDQYDAARPARVLPFDPARNKTFYYWHMFVPGVKAGQLYGYRVHGPFEPEMGLRFDGTKVLLDPYTRAVMYGDNYSREAACRRGDNCARALKSVVMDPRGYDWEGDVPLRRPFSETVIYEMHVGGFTRHPSSGVTPAKRGTYAGLVEKIPYLKSLGVTAVELLPVQQFDEQDAPAGRRNYWGYSPIAFFAAHRGYSSEKDPLGPVREFREMVKALHRAGIEIILDVVVNHTAEGDHNGPTLCYRGLENRVYYILEKNRAHFANYSGCGNTLKGNHSIVRRLITECMHFWVQEMHVDGFRFDLASVLSRDEYGHPLVDPPLLWEIESDPVLAGTKIIAEAWDAAGLYQLGTFVGSRWAEWNGQFRDDVRQFVKSDAGMTTKLANRLVGSPDLFAQPARDIHRSINLITCHDGFSLNDLVTYNDKHNQDNGEQNRDGANDNHSWNCGVEGPSDDQSVEALRLKQIKNLLTILFFAQGTPMLLMGDEVRHTQRGNNNAYCQNNELSWFNWSDVDRNRPLFRFVQQLIRIRREHAVFRKHRCWRPLDGELAPVLSWHGVLLDQPGWDYHSRTLAFSLSDEPNDELLHVMMNAYWEALPFELPALPRGRRWHRIVDTSELSDELGTAPLDDALLRYREYAVQSRSIVVLRAL